MKAMESEYSTTAAAASVDSVHNICWQTLCLNGLKLDVYEVVNIAYPLAEDQTDFDTAAEPRHAIKDQGIEAF